MEDLIRKSFIFADTEVKGYLTKQELKYAVAAALGIRPSKLVLEQMFRQAYESTEVRIDRETFIRVMMERTQKVDTLECIQRAFKAIDIRSQGFISYPTFVDVCRQTMPHISPDTVTSVFQESDRDKDGRVTYNDFEAMYMRSLSLESHPLHAPISHQTYEKTSFFI